MNTITIPKFEIEKDIVHNSPFIEPGFRRFLIVGSTCSGKTFSLLKLLPLIHKPENVFIFCPNIHNQKVYKYVVRFFQDKYKDTNIECYSNLDDIFPVIFEDISKFDETKCNICIVDDFCDTKEMEKCQSLKNLFTQGRHLKFNVFLLSQEFFSIPQACRKNCSDLILFRCNQVQYIYENSGIKSFCNNFKHFLKLYNECCDSVNPENGDRGFFYCCLSPHISHSSLRLRNGIDKVLNCHIGAKADKIFGKTPIKTL